MNELYELMQKIKERPGMYLGKKSLELLHAFLNGYIICLYNQACLCNQYSKLCPDFFPGFQEYIQKKYDIKSSHSWARIIDFYHTSEDDAFDTFFDLWDEFLKSSRSSNINCNAMSTD